MRPLETNPSEKMVVDEPIVFTKSLFDFGNISLRPLVLSQDLETLYSWVTKPYAHYWGMQQYTIEEVKTSYEALLKTDYHKVFMGIHNNDVVFLMEFYEVSKDRLANYYAAKKGDYGMHLLVAPCTKRIPNFTQNIITTVLAYIFSQEEVVRVVVEPDVNNAKIHVLNKKAGFQYDKELQLPEKRAALAFCTRAEYAIAKNKRKTL